MVVDKNDWMITNNKSLRHPNNKQFVTARVNIINKKKVIRISIGLDVCDLIGFDKNDRVHIFINKEDRNLLLIKKDMCMQDGYRLNLGTSNNSFMTFDFRCETQESFRLSQTIILDYDFNDEGSLLINMEKIKWRK
jgi:hypothetical protein